MLPFKMLLSIVLGTLVSLVFGYLYANRKNLFNSYDSKIGSNAFGRFFERLVKIKKAELGSFKTDTSYQREPSKSAKNKWDDLLSKVESGSVKEKKILALKKFVLSLTSTDSSYIKNWSKQFKIPNGEVRILRAARELNIEGHFIKNIEKAEVYGLGEIENMVKSYALLEIYVEEAKTGKLDLLQELCKKKSIHQSYGIKAVEMMIMLKSGASSVGVMKGFNSKIYDQSVKLKTINFDKLNKVYLELIQLSTPETIKKQILTLMTKIVLFEVEERKKEEEKKSSSEQKKSKKKKASVSGHSSLSDAYAILGISPNSNFEMAKKAFKKIAMQKHPDRLMSKNLSEFEMKKAHDEYLKIKSAFEKIEALNSKKAA